MLKNTTCDFNNALVNAEINIKINKCYRIIVHFYFMLTNEPYCKVLPINCIIIVIT